MGSDMRENANNKGQPVCVDLAELGEFSPDEMVGRHE
jgi:hypothetical protein